MPTKNTELEKRFMEKVMRWPPATDCWLWFGFRSPNGYGKFGVNGAPQYAHRVSYSLFVGKIPDGMVVCHKCDTPRCVNPSHLFIGTQAENMADMRAKGRWVSRHKPSTYRGEINHLSKLTDAQAEEIVKLKKAGGSATVIAKQFGISRTHVHHIVDGTRRVQFRPSKSSTD